MRVQGYKRTNFRRRGHDAEGAESIVEQSLIDSFVQTSDEQVCADVELLLIRGSLKERDASISGLEAQYQACGRYGRSVRVDEDKWGLRVWDLDEPC